MLAVVTCKEPNAHLHFSLLADCFSLFPSCCFHFNSGHLLLLPCCFLSSRSLFFAVFFYSLLRIFQNFRRRTFKDEFKDLFKNGMLLSGLLHCRVILKCDVCSYTVGISETACILLRFKYSCSLSTDNYSCSV